jgi:hypothetical protein
LQTSLVVLHSLTIAAQLDYVGGHKVLDLATVGHCIMSTCAALNDPSASLGEQARALAAQNRFVAGYLESGSTVRLRELSMSLHSARMASIAQAGSVSFTLAGRNLVTWSRYEGLDPEIDLLSPGVDSYSGSLVERLYLPNTRQFTARLTLAY